MSCESETLLLLRRHVEKWSECLSLKPRAIRIQKMSRKWGSCSTAGTVTIAVDVAALEQAVQDVIIVHELLHLRIRNHGRLFRALMSAPCSPLASPTASAEGLVAGKSRHRFSRDPDAAWATSSIS